MRLIFFLRLLLLRTIEKYQPHKVDAIQWDCSTILLAPRNEEVRGLGLGSIINQLKFRTNHVRVVAFILFEWLRAMLSLTQHD